MADQTQQTTNQGNQGQQQQGRQNKGNVDKGRENLLFALHKVREDDSSKRLTTDELTPKFHYWISSLTDSDRETLFGNLATLSNIDLIKEFVEEVAKADNQNEVAVRYSLLVISANQGGVWTDVIMLLSNGSDDSLCQGITDWLSSIEPAHAQAFRNNIASCGEDKGFKIVKRIAEKANTPEQKTTLAVNLGVMPISAL